jgi:hypothetical protein
MNQEMVAKLKAEDAVSQAKNRGELLALREASGQVSVKCKCGAESVLDAKRPEKAPKAKCGVCGLELHQ